MTTKTNWDLLTDKERLYCLHLANTAHEIEAIEFAINALPPRLFRPRLPDVDRLSNIIREVDGSNSLGAGLLAEKILEKLAQEGE